MKLQEVYSLFDVEPIKAKGCKIYTADGTEYLDFYGGHAVISIGHSHPYFVSQMKRQIDKMIFYSNSVKNQLQVQLAYHLGKLSGCVDYELFLCNSGAEAVENALKLASFKTERNKVLSIKNCFHGRTSAAVNVTDNQKIKAPINTRFETTFIEMNDIEALKKSLSTHTYAAVIIECIQGVGGLDEANDDFLKEIESICIQTNTAFIVDEIQSGFCRSGDFFAFQKSGVQPDIITIAKGMGNGFPIAGVMTRSGFIDSWTGMLGTTFGGNHLACTACNAVLEVIESEDILANVNTIGQYLTDAILSIDGVVEVKGRGLMLGAKFDYPVAALRASLVYENKLFTGSAKDPNLLRILPPLNISKDDVDCFIDKLRAGIIKHHQALVTSYSDLQN
jgi:acetylornithine/N-succinyldiaminopimelate aminotransferase